MDFQAMVGDQAFSCGQEFDGIGVGKTKIKPLDLRFWIHDVMLVRAGGEAVPLKLKQDQTTSTIRDDGAWQKDNVALLDFEDATGGRNIANGPHAGNGAANPWKDSQIAPFAITPGEKDDLVAFLESLTDTTFLTNPRFSSPFDSK